MVWSSRATGGIPRPGTFRSRERDRLYLRESGHCITVTQGVEKSREAHVGTDEVFDVVIVGAGHNGTTAAAYLAKCGLSVCLLEERPECGGAQEATEPMAGVRIPP
ncbi:FAD-dependent oxidoreductase, partial [Chloroflexota bacterium]